MMGTSESATSARDVVSGKHQNPWGQSSRHRRLERPNADPERLFGFQTEDGFAV